MKSFPKNPRVLTIGLMSALVLTVVLTLTVFLRLLFLQTLGPGKGEAFFSDDALITLRYAANLAAGRGFVYNPGAFVLGTTTPLYALLMALPALLHWNLMLTAALFNTFLDCVSTAVFWKAVSHRTASLKYRAGLTLLFAANPLLIKWAAYGMETSLLVCLAFLTGWTFWNGKHFRSGVFAALLVLTRPDGTLFLAALLAAHLFFFVSSRELFKPWKWLLGFTPLIGAWLVFSEAYFHALVPHSIVAKRIVHGLFPSGLRDILNLGRGFWMLPAALLGAALLCRALPSIRSAPDAFGRWALTHALWAIFLGAFFALTRAPANLYEWYRVPLYAALSVVAAAGLLYPRRAREANKNAAPLLALACLVPLFLFLVVPVAGMLVRSGPSRTASPAAMHLSVGKWLRDNTPPASTVLAGNIGYIGFYSGRRILDDVGIVSPEVLPVLIANRGDASPLIETFKPDFLALEAREAAAMQAAILRSGCEQVYEIVSETPTPQSPYRVYRCRWNPEAGDSGILSEPAR